MSDLSSLGEPKCVSQSAEMRHVEKDLTLSINRNQQADGTLTACFSSVQLKQNDYQHMSYLLDDGVLVRK